MVTSSKHQIYPVFIRLTIYMMMTALSGECVSHGDDFAIAERIDVVADLFGKYVLCDLAAPN